MTKFEVREELITNITYYQDLINPTLLKKAELLKYEDLLFHNDIETQFLYTIRTILAEDLTKRFQITAEDAIISLEEIDLKGFLC